MQNTVKQLSFEYLFQEQLKSNQGIKNKTKILVTTLTSHFADKLISFKNEIIEQLSSNIDKYEEPRQEFYKIHTEYCETINPAFHTDGLKELLAQHVIFKLVFSNIFMLENDLNENHIYKQFNKLLAIDNSVFSLPGEVKTVFDEITHVLKLNETLLSDDIHHLSKFASWLFSVCNEKEIDYKSYDHYDSIGNSKDIINEINRYYTNQFSHDPYTRTNTIYFQGNSSLSLVNRFLDSIQQDYLPYKLENNICLNGQNIFFHYLTHILLSKKLAKENQQLTLKTVLSDPIFNMGMTKNCRQQNLWLEQTENIRYLLYQNQQKYALIISNLADEYSTNSKAIIQSGYQYPNIDNQIKECTGIPIVKSQPNHLVFFKRNIIQSTNRLAPKGMIAYIVGENMLQLFYKKEFKKFLDNEFSTIRISAIENMNENNLMDNQNIFLVLFEKKPGSDICKYYSESEKAEHTVAKSTNENENTMPVFIKALNSDFHDLIPLFPKQAKLKQNAIFRFSPSGIQSKRDEWVFDYDKNTLLDKVKYFADVYNKAQKHDLPKELHLSKKLEYKRKNEILIDVDPSQIVQVNYRPFQGLLYYSDNVMSDGVLNDARLVHGFGLRFQNKTIVLKKPAENKPIQLLGSNIPVDSGFMDQAICLPFYFYDSDGIRHENISDFAVRAFQKHYNKPGQTAHPITREQIFFYIYAVLHSNTYHDLYGSFMAKFTPGIPFNENFYELSEKGKKLFDMHVNYQVVEPHELNVIKPTIKVGAPPPPEILNPEPILKIFPQKNEIVIDNSTQVQQIPAEAFSYFVNGKPALEWAVGMYKDKKSKYPVFKERFNQTQFSRYKYKLIESIKRITTVSIKTKRIINEIDAILT